MRVTVLGCGSSGGVPLIGCTCKVCTSGNPKNRRLRVSLFIGIDGRNILIDTSPDLRQQALTFGIRRVDAVLYTHDHADHTHGLDDLRSFNYLGGHSIPLHGDAKTMGTITSRFAYAFLPKPENVWYRPSLEARALPNAPVHAFDVLGVPIIMFEQLHGTVKTVGYRIGDFAYSTDVKDLPPSAFEALAGVKVWVVDCLRYRESTGHSTLEKTLGWIGQVKPGLAVLTHMAHDFDYDDLSKELPAGVVPGYDGMVIAMSDDAYGIIK